MTPEFGASQPAREDRHARPRRRRRDQQVRAPRRRGRPARRRSPDGAQPRGLRQEARRHARLRHLGRHLQRRRRHRALPGAARPARRARARRVDEGVLPRVATGSRPCIAPSCPPSRVRYLAEISDTVRGYHEDTERYRRTPPAACSGSSRVRGELDRAGRRRRQRRERGRAVEALLDQARTDLPLSVAGASSPAGRRSSSPTPATSRSSRVRDKEIRNVPDAGVVVGQQDPSGLAAALLATTASSSASCAARTCPATSPSPPASSRSSATTRTPRACSPARATRSAPTAASSCSREGQPATRLSTAFDSVTLYGRDPDPRPDVYGKVGTSGVSVATLDDMKALYDGFDLVSPDDERLDDDQRPGADDPRLLPQHRHRPAGRRLRAAERAASRAPRRRDELRHTPSPDVRGTVQADILKEDQGQNTCLFSTEFSLRMMADIQEWFIEQKVRNFYSVSISGLPHRRGRGEPDQPARVHPRQRLHLRRGLPRARHGRSTTSRRTCRSSSPTAWTPSTPCIGRVARRIWAVAMKEKYGANERSQKLKYHVQTSGRSPARAGDGLQRHPHHAAGAHRDLRQRQQPAHQRLRRGRHDPVRGVGASRPRDPDDHQPRSGASRSTRTRSRARSSSTS